MLPTDDSYRWPRQSAVKVSLLNVGSSRLHVPYQASVDTFLMKWQFRCKLIHCTNHNWPVFWHVSKLNYYYYQQCLCCNLMLPTAVFCTFPKRKNPHTVVAMYVVLNKLLLLFIFAVIVALSGLMVRDASRDGPCFYTGGPSHGTWLGECNISCALCVFQVWAGFVA